MTEITIGGNDEKLRRTLESLDHKQLLQVSKLMYLVELGMYSLKELGEMNDQELEGLANNISDKEALEAVYNHHDTKQH